MVSGVTNYRNAKELSQNYPRLEESFLTGLREMANIIFNRNNLTLSITANEQEVSTFKEHCSSLISALPNTIHSRQTLTPPDSANT